MFICFFDWEFPFIKKKSKENRISSGNFEHLRENKSINKPNQVTLLQNVTIPKEGLTWDAAKTTLKKKKKERKWNIQCYFLRTSSKYSLSPHSFLSLSSGAFITLFSHFGQIQTYWYYSYYNLSL